MKEASLRNLPVTGPLRDAYEEFRDWAMDTLFPMVKRQAALKIAELARKHGITVRELAGLLLRPPIGESRPEMIKFIYNTFSY